MGMYTYFDIDIILRKDTPDDVKWLLWALIENDPDFTNVTLPSHPFWITEHLTSLGAGRHDGKVYDMPRFEDPLVRIRCELKNYDKEIQKFLDWITPYVESASEGSYRYEESWIESYVGFDGRFFIVHPHDLHRHGDTWGCSQDKEQDSLKEYIKSYS